MPVKPKSQTEMQIIVKCETIFGIESTELWDRHITGGGVAAGERDVITA